MMEVVVVVDQKKEEQEVKDVIEPSFVLVLVLVLERKLEQALALEWATAPSAPSVSSRRAAPGADWQSDSPGPAH